MSRRIIFAALLVASLGLGGCAELQSALNAVSPSTAPSPIVTTVTLDATKGLYAAESTVDVMTVAAGKAADAGLIRGAAAQKVLNLVNQAHGYIEAAHAGVTLGDQAAIAANAQAAINAASQAHALTPGT